jgi:hypothetical protein
MRGIMPRITQMCNPWRQLIISDDNSDQTESVGPERPW